MPDTAFNILPSDAICARHAVIGDIPHILKLAMAAEGYGRFKPDWGEVEKWLYRVIPDPNMCVAVAPNAVAVACLINWFYRPDPPEAMVVFIFGNVWQVTACLRFVIAWAQGCGAKVVRIDSETDLDLGPVVRRICGDVRQSPAYTLQV